MVELEEMLMWSFVGCSAKKRLQGKEHIRKKNLPKFDVQVLESASHGESFPQSSTIFSTYPFPAGL